MLAIKEPASFAGLWIEHKPQFRVVVQLTAGGKETLRPYVEHGPLADLIDVRYASVTSTKLEADQAESIRLLERIGVKADFSINIKNNFVEVNVTDPEQLQNTLQSAGVQLPRTIKIIKVSKLISPAADIYAGLGVNGCTTGFSAIYRRTNDRVMTTAGHCPDQQSYQGKALPFQGQITAGSVDLQFHLSLPNYSSVPLMYIGSSTRTVTGTKSRANQAAGSLVCKYGVNTKYTCGYIANTTTRPIGYLTNPNATFVRVSASGVVQCREGDSGGPWFNGNTAYGITSGYTGDDCVYMAVDYYNDMELTVLTQ